MSELDRLRAALARAKKGKALAEHTRPQDWLLHEELDSDIEKAHAALHAAELRAMGRDAEEAKH